MISAVAYFRVSAVRQGQSGLGLEAQEAAVSALIARMGAEVVASYKEIESGRRKDRPQLLAALDLCRQRKAMLVIAKLDRLARNVAFVSGLIESGVDFIAADMPEANRLTVHILAAVAEHEREAISARTREALAAAKARGQRLGNPRPDMAKVAIAAADRASDFRAKRLHQVKAALASSGTLRKAAQQLNELGVPTLNGRRWHPQTVARLLKRTVAN